MRGEIQDFRDLIVWQKAMQLTKLVYALTAKFPPDERFGLTLQLRRAAISVPSNIAEGHERGRKEFRSFLSIARGSAAEVQCQLLIAIDLGYLSEDALDVPLGLCREIARMAAALIRRLATS